MPRIFSNIPSAAGFAFTIFQTPFGTSPTATSANDALTFTGSSQVIITGDASSKTINIGITNLPASGITTGSIGTTFPLFNQNGILGVTFGTANGNQYLSINSGGSAMQYRSLAGTPNQITLSVLSITTIFGLPQDIAQGSNVQFGGVSAGYFKGSTFYGSNLGISSALVGALTVTNGLTSGYIAGLSSMAMNGYLDIQNVTAPVAPGSSYLRFFSQTQGGVDSLSYLDSLGVQVGLGQDVDFPVFNNSGITLLIGSPIRFNGAVVTLDGIITPCISLANGSSSTRLADYLLTSNAGASLSVRAMKFGILRNFDTFTPNFGLGTVLYLGTTDGLITATPPLEPNFVQRVGKVYRSSTLGIIEVSVQDVNASVDQTTGNIGVQGYIDLKNITTPAAPGASFLRIFSRTGFGIDSLTYVDSNNIEVGLGQDVDITVFNNSGTTYPAGTVIRFGGLVFSTVPPIPTMSPALASVQATIGDWMLMQPVGASLAARAMKIGVLQNVDTSAYPVATVLYLSGITAGALSATAPISPNYSQRVGKVLTQNASLGRIYVEVQDIDGNETGTNSQFYRIGNGKSGPIGLFLTGVTSMTIWANPVGTAVTNIIPGFTSGNFVMDGATNSFIGRNTFFGGSYLVLSDFADSTKKAMFNLSQIGTGATYYYTVPNIGGTFVLQGNTQSIANTEIMARGISLTNGATLLADWTRGDVFDIAATGATMTFPGISGPLNRYQMAMYKVSWGTTNGQYAYGATFKGSTTLILPVTASGISAMDVFLWQFDPRRNQVQLLSYVPGF